jgi:hypothetical protein
MRPASLFRLLPCLAACGVLAIAAGGCGSSAALDPVAQAAEATKQAGGVHMAIKGSVTLPSSVGAGPISIDGDGFYNYKSKEGSFTLAMSGLPAIAQVSAGSMKIDSRIKGTTAYVGTDLFAGKLPGGARWAKLDLAKFGAGYGLSAQQLTGGQSNPAQLLEFLKGSKGGVQKIGPDQVRGVPTTRYRGAIDLAKFVDQVPDQFRSQARSMVEQLTQKTGVSSFPVEVWVDAQNRVRRFDMSLTLSESGQGLTVAMQVEMFDYGQTPAVEAPAAGETYDLTQAALSRLGTSGG